MSGNSETFQEFVAYAIRIGALQLEDILVVDNCTIHFKGENKFVEDVLYKYHNISLIPLPAYSLELNPIEKVFNTLVQCLKSRAAQSESNSDWSFIDTIHQILRSITVEEVRKYEILYSLWV